MMNVILFFWMTASKFPLNHELVVDASSDLADRYNWFRGMILYTVKFNTAKSIDQYLTYCLKDLFNRFSALHNSFFHENIVESIDIIPTTEH